MTAATRRYLGPSTPFGTITSISGGVYNPEATVQARDGSMGVYRLPFLIAHGMSPAVRVAA